MTRQARAQQRRRDAARSRGDCGVCCRRPAEPGKFQCVSCADRKRTMGREERLAWAQRTRCDQCEATHLGMSCARCGKVRRGTGRYQALRDAKLCVVCKVDSPDRHACLPCRLAMKAKREASRLWSAVLPAAASARKVGASIPQDGLTPQIEGQSV